MKEALDAQVAYAAEHLHVNGGECRNIGDVRDFIRLYRFTGERRYLDEALRLFRELRPKLSTGRLFDQSGKPLDPDPPFIDEDQRGLEIGYAKPYIIGYALAGLPDLMAFAPSLISWRPRGPRRRLALSASAIQRRARVEPGLGARLATDAGGAGARP